MLNRRILRVKAMQYLYAYEQCKRANFEVALDLIAERFLPDLNSMIPQDLNLLNQEKQVAQELFRKQYEEERPIFTDTTISNKIREAARSGINYYHQQNKKDLDRLRIEMLSAAEGVFVRYLKVMKLLVQLADFVDYEYNEWRKKPFHSIVVMQHELKFHKNVVIMQMRNHAKLQEHFKNKGVKWDEDVVRQCYKVMVKDEQYQTYKNLPATTPEQEYEIVNYLLREFILKNDVVLTVFEEEDISWTENKSVIKSMTTKTLKALQESGIAAELSELAVNWDDDREFFKDLFIATVKEQKTVEPFIAAKTKNWEIDRITLIDRIILNMALAEMMTFPSIPVKVSINEYIELSKNYSTPKSRVFVNGLLNTISEEMLKAAYIRKSGRGLLDNK